MTTEYDERYINDEYLDGLCSDYTSNAHFKNITLREKNIIIKDIRHRLSIILSGCSVVPGGDRSIAGELLELDQVTAVPSTTISFLDLRFLLACVKKDFDKVSCAFACDNINIPADDNHKALRDEYLNMIADMTKCLIREINDSFSLTNKSSSGTAKHNESNPPSSVARSAIKSEAKPVQDVVKSKSRKRGAAVSFGPPSTMFIPRRRLDSDQEDKRDHSTKEARLARKVKV